MAKIEIKANLCKGCGLCIVTCPKKIIRVSEEMNQKGYNIAEQFDSEKCTACKMCAIICPDGAISVYKEEKKNG